MKSKSMHLMATWVCFINTQRSLSTLNTECAQGMGVLQNDPEGMANVHKDSNKGYFIHHLSM